jgi:Lon protease-like protein
MSFWRRKQEALEGEAGGEPTARRSRSTSVAVRPIPEDALILVPMRAAVLFPGIVSPLAVGRGASVSAVQEAVRQGRKLGFLLQRDPKADHVAGEDLHWVGTAGEIVRYVPAGEGVHHLAVQGQSRFRATEFLEGWPFLVARVVWVPEATEGGEDIEARFLQLKTQAAEAIRLLPNVPSSSCRAEPSRPPGAAARASRPRCGRRRRGVRPHVPRRARLRARTAAASGVRRRPGRPAPFGSAPPVDGHPRCGLPPCTRGRARRAG